MKQFITVLALVFATLAGSAQAMGPKPPDPTLAAAATASAAAGSALAASAAAGAQAKQSALAASASARDKAEAKADADRAEEARAKAEAAAVAARKSQQAVAKQGVADEFRWKNPGADPYAASRDKAMETRVSALQKLGLPAEVVALLAEATKKPGEEVKLPMGTRLTAMLSKGGVAHRNTVVEWQSPIVGTEFVAPAEKWTVTFDGKAYTAYLFKVCNNWSSVVGPAPTPPAAPVAAAPPPTPSVTRGCPKGIVLFANAWTMESMPDDLRKQAEALISAATLRDSQNASNPEAYKPDALSRTMGDELILVVKVRAPVGVSIRAQLLDPVTTQVVEDLGEFRLTDGIAKIYLKPEQRLKIVQTIWPAWFDSPTVSGGERRLWLFPNEWMNKTGGRYCTKQVNGAYRQMNKPNL